jgi:hypothetical protein
MVGPFDQSAHRRDIRLVANLIGSIPADVHGRNGRSAHLVLPLASSSVKDLPQGGGKVSAANGSSRDRGWWGAMTDGIGAESTGEMDDGRTRLA